MDGGEEDATARSGGTHKAEGGIDRFGAPSIGHAFPEKQGTTGGVTSSCPSALIEMVLRTIEGDEDHRRRYGREHLAEAPLLCCHRCGMIHFTHADLFHAREARGTSITACSQDDNVFKALVECLQTCIVDGACAGNARGACAWPAPLTHLRDQDAKGSEVCSLHKESQRWAQKSLSKGIRTEAMPCWRDGFKRAKQGDERGGTAGVVMVPVSSSKKTTTHSFSKTRGCPCHVPRERSTSPHRCVGRKATFSSVVT